MKITIKEDGSLILDGENNTVITADCDAGINFKIQGNNCHCFTDFIKIEGDKPNSAHEIYNFVLKGTGKVYYDVVNTEGDTTGKIRIYNFGDEEVLSGHKCKYIGKWDGKHVLWDTDRLRIVFGQTEEENKIYEEKLNLIKNRSWWKKLLAI